jgi:hypothetical protein
VAASQEMNNTSGEWAAPNELINSDLSEQTAQSLSALVKSSNTARDAIK